jgi:hypothetical protein
MAANCGTWGRSHTRRRDLARCADRISRPLGQVGTCLGMAQKVREQRGFAARGRRILPVPPPTGGWISTGGCYPARMKNVRSRVVQHGGLDRQGTDKFSETKSRSRHNFLTAVLPPSILFAVLTAVTESLKVLEQTIHLYGEDACHLAVNAGKDSTAVLHLCEIKSSPLQTNHAHL